MLIGVGADTLTILQSAISGISACTNPSVAISGSDEEVDGLYYRPDTTIGSTEKAVAGTITVT